MMEEALLMQRILLDILAFLLFPLRTFIFLIWSSSSMYGFSYVSFIAVFRWLNGSQPGYPSPFLYVIPYDPKAVTCLQSCRP